jgi:acetyl-CoA acetyltransferase family protein
MLAGGVESMTRAPFVMAKSQDAYEGGNRTVYDSSLGWRFPNQRIEQLFPLEQMGETAENLAEQIGIDRESQDRFALESHQKAVAAEREGRFDDERVPVMVQKKKGEGELVERDEGPRAETSYEKLAELKPAFRKPGTVTAGNSSTLNDGAACLVLASGAAMKNLGVPPLARWVGSQSAGVNPRIMGVGPVPAIEKLLARSRLSLRDIDLLEINEAFAAQVLGVLRRLGADEEIASRVNVNGGAIALGHPLGASGARILTTLVHEMRRRGAARGIASLCVGVGQGVATLVEAP